MAKIQLTQEFVRDLFDYKCGELIWKNSCHPKRNGKYAGCWCESTGYIYIGISSNSYTAHQIIFLWHHGYIPKLIDHKDRNRVNNWIENLRECDRVQNQANRSHAELPHKYKGVRKSKLLSDKWECIFNKNVVGLFDNEEDAALEYNKWAKNIHGEYAYLNRIEL